MMDLQAGEGVCVVTDSNPVANETSDMPAPRPVVDDVCARTRALLGRSDLYTDELVDAVCSLLDEREKLNTAQILDALSPSGEEPREDSQA